MKFDIENLYSNYLAKKSETRRKELDKDKVDDIKRYRASSTGMCARKIYYETILRLTPTDKPNQKTMRIFRLGDLIHTDIQNAVIQEFENE
jgi:hypothetical protein